MGFFKTGISRVIIRSPCDLWYKRRSQKLESLGYTSVFGFESACDGQTDGHAAYAYIAL